MNGPSSRLRGEIFKILEEEPAINPPSKTQHAFYRFVHRLDRSRFRPAARVLLRAVKFHRRNQPVKPAEKPPEEGEALSGPFEIRNRNSRGDLLIFVPRSIESHLIDHMTGGYGYSHLAVDSGEVDVPTGKGVMVESTVNHPVSRAAQDRYGRRPYIRICMGETGIDTGEFCRRVLTLLGEPYDNLEALTYGVIDDPAKQICSDVAATCLPAEVMADIAAQGRAGRLGKNAISVHHAGTEEQHAFVSPNGFARYFNAPPGMRVRRPETVVHPGRRAIPSK